MSNRIHKHLHIYIILLLIQVLICGCAANSGDTPKAAAFDGENYIRISELTETSDSPVTYNLDSKLSVPTYITRVDDTWFIVDCYHNKIIYSTELGTPLTEWKIMTGEPTQPHTLASDGIVYLVDDTEHNRVMVFEKRDSDFIKTQVIDDIGNRPHYTVYDKNTDTFYVWSSTTGELYCFRHTPDSTRMYLTDIRKIDVLDGIYVRSFSIIDGDIYFASGVAGGLPVARIYCCDLETLEIKKTIDVPDNLAGMVQITKIQNYYYITTSTDLSGNQDYATLVRCKNLDKLASGDYEDIYSQYFIGGGTPYYISNVDDTYFLTEHRLKDHSIWSFKVKKDKITDVTAIY